MKETIEILALVIAGPMVGVEFGVAAFTNPMLGRLPDDALGRARSDSSRILGKVMPFWYFATLALLIATTVATGGGPLLIAAAVLMALVVLLTVTMLVPINNRIGKWADASDVSRELARRWDRLHWVRVGLLAVVFVLLVVAVATA